MTATRNPAQSANSIQYVSTGETLSFEIRNQTTMVIDSGSHQMSIERAEVEAYSPQGPTFPPAVRAQASTLFHGLSEGFRAALGTLARTGCEGLIEFFPIGLRYAYLFFDDIPCTTPPTGFVHPVDPVHAFDPAVTPPGPFEQPFGTAYHE
jgi:hypothetical protein